MQEIFIHFAKLDFIELIQGGKKKIYIPGSAAVDGLYHLESYYSKRAEAH